jgi:hypothetical protein
MVSRHPEYVGLFGPRAAAGLAIYTHDHDHRHDLAGEVVALPPDQSRAEGAKSPDPVRTDVDAG